MTTTYMIIQEYSPLDVRIHVHVVPQAISAGNFAWELETRSWPALVLRLRGLLTDHTYEYIIYLHDR